MCLRPRLIQYTLFLLEVFRLPIWRNLVVGAFLSCDVALEFSGSHSIQIYIHKATRFLHMSVKRERVTNIERRDG